MSVFNWIGFLFCFVFCYGITTTSIDNNNIKCEKYQITKYMCETFQSPHPHPQSHLKKQLHHVSIYDFLECCRHYIH